MSARRAMTGVLLAGGRSRRMGIDKASAGFEFEGEPLAARVVRLLGDTCDEILVASGDGERLAWLGLPQVRDARAHRGPLSGVVAGLEAASNDLVAVVAVDMPFVNARLLRELARLRVEDDALIPMSARGAEPLHAVYARTAAGPLRDRLETGTLAIRAAVETLAVRYVQEDVWRTFDPSGAFASNLNRPSDLGPAPSLTRRSARRDRAPDRSG